MEKQFLFSQSCCIAQSSQVQERGWAVGLSWAACVEISEAAVHWIPKCAHRLLAWKNVGSIKQGLFEAVVEVLICSSVSSLSASCAQGGPCCAWLRAAHTAAWSEEHNQGKSMLSLCKQFPRFILFMDSFQSAWKEPPFCMTFNVCLADTGLGGSEFRCLETANTISDSTYALIGDCLEKSSLKRLNEDNLRISFKWVIVQSKKNVNLVPPVAVWVSHSDYPVLKSTNH